MNNRENTNLILLFFFVTGLTGLAYELVWIRLLILVFGSTQFAVTTVLTTFMAGLAIGSLIFGRYVDKHPNPIRLYAIIELAIGAYCLLSPAVFELLRHVYLWSLSPDSSVNAGFNITQFALSFIGLIIPTTLMGGTLPILVKYLATRRDKVGFSTAVAYSVNTLGAVAGCLLTGLLALYLLGVKSTLYAAGTVDIIAGILLFYLFREAAAGGAAPAQEAPDSPASTPGAGVKMDKRLAVIVLSVFTVSGFCSLVYEVLWTRVLSLVIGSSVYAFTVMLATFLLGIGLGSIIFAPFIDRRKNPLLWFAVFEAVIGFASLASIILYRKLPFIFYGLHETYGERFWLFLVIEFSLCALLMIIPTLSMGAIFPLVGRIMSRATDTVGKNIGDVYFYNTAGAIFGSFVGGFILMPLLGVQKGVILIAAVNISLAIILVFASGVSRVKWLAASVPMVIVFAIVSLSMPSWDKTVMTLGLYSNIFNDREMTGFEAGRSADEIVYYKEGINAIVTVRKGGPGGRDISYQANGKMEARARGARPAETWSLLGHIPMLLMERPPENALLVGLGSGITLGAMESYPVRSVDVVELEPAVAEAAAFFSESNNHALEDPRTKLHITDGRNFVFTTEETYDVIISAVSDPWITGVSNLFTQEYFTELKEKLSDDGTVALWFQNYRIRPEELKIGLQTFASVFPDVSVWFHYSNAADLIVIGTKRKHTVNLDTLRRWYYEEEVSKDLKRIDINGPMDILDLFLIGNDDLRAYIGDAPVNTDERPLLEFTLPKLLYMDPSMSIKIVEELIGRAEEVAAPHTFPEGWTDGDKADFYYGLGRKYSLSNFRLRQAVELLEKALDLNPSHEGARSALLSLKKELGIKDG